MDIPFASRFSIQTPLGEIEIAHSPYIPASEIEQINISVNQLMPSGHTFMFYGMLDARRLLGNVIEGKYVSNPNPMLVFVKDTNAQLFKLVGKKKNSAAAELLTEHKRLLLEGYLQVISINQPYFHTILFETEIERLARRTTLFESIANDMKGSWYE